MSGRPVNLLILSMDVDLENECESEYRILIDKQVKYLKITPNTFGEDVLIFPLAYLPPLETTEPNKGWTIAHISRNPDSGKLNTSLSSRKLAGVQNAWHPTRINVLDLERTVQRAGRVYEAELNVSLLPPTKNLAVSSCPPLSQRKTIIAKIARFEWEIPLVEQETRAYQILQQQERQGTKNLAPQFLGHLHEHGRIMGFILEKLEDQEPASLASLEKCERTLRRFHDLGLVHGDVNRHNFLVDLKNDNGITLIDFEHFQESVSPSLRAEEMERLSGELMDTSGRGGGLIYSHDEN